MNWFFGHRGTLNCLANHQLTLHKVNGLWFKPSRQLFSRSNFAHVNTNTSLHAKIVSNHQQLPRETWFRYNHTYIRNWPIPIAAFQGQWHTTEQQQRQQQQQLCKGAGMAQWWKHTPIKLGVICGLSLLVLYSAPSGFSQPSDTFLPFARQALHLAMQT